MKNIKKLSILLIILGLFFIFTSCVNTNDSHKHNYSSTYSYNETYHYLECLDSDCDSVKNKGTHIFNNTVINNQIVYTCSVCGYSYSEDYTKEEVSFVVNNELDKVYDGNSVTIDYTTNSDGNVTIKYSTDNENFNLDTAINANHYYVKVVIEETTTYQAYENVFEFTISKATPTYTVPEKVSAKENDKLSDVDLSSYNLEWVNPDTAVTSGNVYEAKTIQENENYEVVSGIMIKVVVVKMLDIPTLNVSYIYNNEEHSVNISDITNYNSEYMSLTTESVMTATLAGTYHIYVQLLNKEEYSWNNNTFDDLELSWTIGKATQTAPSDEIIINDLVYSSSLTLSDINIGVDHYSWLDSTVHPTVDVTTYQAIYNIDSANYQDVIVNITINLTKATPEFTVPSNLTGLVGETLSTVDLPTNFTWDEGDTVILEGSNNYNATYTPNDIVNYNIVACKIDVKGNTESYPFMITLDSGSGEYNVVEDNGYYVITFTTISAKTVYSISGDFTGEIVIDAGSEYKFELSMNGLNLTSNKNNPITILSADKVTLTAKKGFSNTITDARSDVSSDEAQYSATIYSLVDLDLGGKGELTVVSENNNGIHTKDDLNIKNLTLNVTCVDNALKGNDSVTIESGTLKIIATGGDAIKTSNSVVKYNDDGSVKKIQGDVTISGGTIELYAATDGIDASHDVVINGEVNLSIYTDKYSPYSGEVTQTSSSTIYVRATTTNYKYSLLFYNSNTGATSWVNSTSYTKVSSGRPGGSSYYYYQMSKPTGYDKVTVYVYSSSQTQGQTTSYTATSGLISVNTNYDTISYSNSRFSWTNYQTSSGGGFGPGGMNDGNKDKGDYSTKGLKANNEILIAAGNIYIKSYDDAIHTNKDVVLGDEDDATDDYYGTGNINITGGVLTLYSNDDGIHADNILNISGGTINITNSYEGLEGVQVLISDGSVSVTSSDDGINSTATTGNGITISGGYVYVYANGDGIDSNSQTSYQGIIFSGGKTVVIQTSGGNSAIDTERGYTHSGGYVLAISPTNAMTSEMNTVQSTGKTVKSSLSSSTYLHVSVSSSEVLTIKLPKSMTMYVMYFGSSSATITSNTTNTNTLDANGIYWNV